MDLWTHLVVIGVVGFLGGLFSSIFTTDTMRPSFQVGIRHPGHIGNMIAGAVAAIVSWGLYGPHSGAPLMGPETPAGTQGGQFSMTLASFVGAFIIGMSGVKWLSAEVDKHLEKRTSSGLMKMAGYSDAEVENMEAATPKKRYEMVKSDTQENGVEKA